jgi:hypothetical protein
MTLNLEQLAFEHGNNSQLKSKRDVSDCYEFEPIVSPQQVSQSLAIMAQQNVHLIHIENSIASAFVLILRSVSVFYVTALML